MRVDGLKIEFPSDQEDDRLDGCDAREAACFALLLLAHLHAVVLGECSG